MGLTQEQYQQGKEYLKLYPEDRSKILSAMAKLSRQQDGSLSRMGSLFMDHLWSGLTMGFGEESQYEPRGFGEYLAAGAGEAVGMLPSFAAIAATGGAAAPVVGSRLGALGARLAPGAMRAGASLLERGAASGLGKAAARYGLPKIAGRMAHDAAVVGTHSALSKQPGETGFFGQNLGSSLEAGAHGALTGAALGGAMGAASPGMNPLAEGLAKRIGDKAMRYGVRPAAMTGAGTAMGMAQGGSFEQSFGQSLGMGLLSIMGKVGPHFSEVRAKETLLNMQAKAAKGETFSTEEIAEIARTYKQYPEITDDMSIEAKREINGLVDTFLGMADAKAEFDFGITADQAKAVAGAKTTQLPYNDMIRDSWRKIGAGPRGTAYQKAKESYAEALSGERRKQVRADSYDSIFSLEQGGPYHQKLIEQAERLGLPREALERMDPAELERNLVNHLETVGDQPRSTKERPFPLATLGGTGSSPDEVKARIRGELPLKGEAASPEELRAMRGNALGRIFPPRPARLGPMEMHGGRLIAALNKRISDVEGVNETARNAIGEMGPEKAGWLQNVVTGKTAKGVNPLQKRLTESPEFSDANISAKLQFALAHEFGGGQFGGIWSSELDASGIPRMMTSGMIDAAKYYIKSEMRSSKLSNTDRTAWNHVWQRLNKMQERIDSGEKTEDVLREAYGLGKKEKVAEARQPSKEEVDVEVNNLGVTAYERKDWFLNDELVADYLASGDPVRAEAFERIKAEVESSRKATLEAFAEEGKNDALKGEPKQEKGLLDDQEYDYYEVAYDAHANIIKMDARMFGRIDRELTKTIQKTTKDEPGSEEQGDIKSVEPLGPEAPAGDFADSMAKLGELLSEEGVKDPFGRDVSPGEARLKMQGQEGAGYTIGPYQVWKIGNRLALLHESDMVHFIDKSYKYDGLYLEDIEAVGIKTDIAKKLGSASRKKLEDFANELEREWAAAEKADIEHAKSTTKKQGPGASVDEELVIEGKQDRIRGIMENLLGTKKEQLEETAEYNQKLEEIAMTHFGRGDRVFAELDLAELEVLESRLYSIAHAKAVDAETGLRGFVPASMQNALRTVMRDGLYWISAWWKVHGQDARTDPRNITVPRATRDAAMEIMEPKPASKIDPVLLKDLENRQWIEYDGENVKLTQAGWDGISNLVRHEWGEEGQIVRSRIGKTEEYVDETGRKNSFIDPAEEYVVNSETGKVVWDPLDPDAGGRINVKEMRLDWVEGDHVLGPNEKVIGKTASDKMYDRMRLRMQANLFSRDLSNRFRKTFDGFREEAKSRGEDWADAMTRLPEKFLVNPKEMMKWKQSDRSDYDPNATVKVPTFSKMEVDGREVEVFRGMKDVQGGNTSISFVDILEERYTPDGRRIMSLSDPVEHPQYQVNVETLVREGKVPEWYVPHLEKVMEINREVAGIAEGMGLTVKDANGETRDFTPRSLYAPLHIDPNLFKSISWRESMADRFMDRGDFKSRKAAMNHVMQMIRHHQGGIRRAGNLERSRDFEPMEGYMMSPDARFNIYGERISQRLVDAQLFGNNNQRGLGLVTEAALQGADIGSALKAFNRAIGVEKYDENITKLSEGMRHFTAITRMGWSFIPQFFQTVNIATMADLNSTIRGIARSFTKEGKDFALESAATLTETVSSANAALQGIKGGYASKWPHLRIFMASDGLVRRFAANSAVFYLNKIRQSLERDLNDNVAKQRLKELNLDPEVMVKAINSKSDLPANFVNDAAFYLSAKTQFLARPENLPLMWQSPVGALLTQFKGFIYHQSRFLYEGIRHAPNARIGALRAAKYMAMASVAGEVVASAMGILRGQKREPLEENSDYFNRWIWDLSYAGGMGIALDMVRAFTGGRLQAADFLAGPSVATLYRSAGDLGGSVGKFLQQEIDGEPVNFTKTFGQPIRTGLRFIPAFGATLGRMAVPPERSQYAATWPGGPMTDLGGFPMPQGTKEILTGIPQDPMENLEYRIQRMRREMKKITEHTYGRLNKIKAY